MTNEQTLAVISAKISNLENSISYMKAIMDTPNTDDAKVYLLTTILADMDANINKTIFDIKKPNLKMDVPNVNIHKIFTDKQKEGESIS